MLGDRGRHGGSPGPVRGQKGDPPPAPAQRVLRSGAGISSMVLYPETIRSVRQFLRQEHLEPAGAPFFLSAVSFFERKESRFYSRLYIPVEG